MSIKIYHQVGHNDGWNINSFVDDKYGDGLIFSPVHQNYEKITGLDDNIKQRAMFDPQYYLPNSQKRKLNSYEFFPEMISGGFSTIDYPLVALQSAELCVSFQIEQNFEKLIVPTRYIDQMVGNYIERQMEYTVSPFLKSIDDSGTNIPVYLTLSLTSHMIEDEIFRTKLLNWVTGFPEIAGVYVLASYERSTKQIQSESFLKAYLDFLVSLRQVDLDVVVGHCNTESMLFSIVNDITLTFGTFENTRMFSLDKFIESDEARRGPKARIYLPGLLNWVQFSHAKEIQNDAPALWSDIYAPTRYGDEALGLDVEPRFNQPTLYKHHFASYYPQIQQLSDLSQVDRYGLIREWITQAIQNHQRVTDMPLDLDVHGKGDHLQAWLDCANWFYRKYLSA